MIRMSLKLDSVILNEPVELDIALPQPLSFTKILIYMILRLQKNRSKASSTKPFKDESNSAFKSL